jgi:hypothetical protein
LTRRYLKIRQLSQGHGQNMPLKGTTAYPHTRAVASKTAQGVRFAPAGWGPAKVRSQIAAIYLELDMIILGIILLIIGFIAKIAIVWTIGIIVLVVGLILALLGTLGHAVGGRRHYF